MTSDHHPEHDALWNVDFGGTAAGEAMKGYC